MISERQAWFRRMINKRLWRNNYCPCEMCKDTYENGILITNQNHADYCYDNECDYAADGHPLKYFETKEQRDEFEKTIKPR